MPGAVVTGWGIAVPDKVVTNEDLSARLDTSDEWITERTGIRERRIGGTTAELAIAAGAQALARAGRTGDDVDVLVLATSTPDALVPGTSATVQEGLGVRGGAFDVNAACSGFVYALVAVLPNQSAGKISDDDDKKEGKISPNYIDDLVSDGKCLIVDKRGIHSQGRNAKQTGDHDNYEKSCVLGHSTEMNSERSQEFCPR